MPADRFGVSSSVRRALIGACASLVLAGASFAQEAGGLALTERPDVWDLAIGEHWSAQPQDFQEFACGTNGGPPSLRLTGFGDFATCAPEEGTGLHEVQFRYDDLLEYWARALEAPPLIERYEGTRVFNQPVVLSLLIGDDGIVRGLRVVSDDRAPDRTRQLAYTLADAARAHFGGEGWTCRDLPPAEGEEDFGGRFVKEDCWKATDTGGTIFTQSRLLRRPGQTLFDPADNRVRQGYFVSVGRFEVVAVSLDTTDTPDGPRDFYTEYGIDSLRLYTDPTARMLSDLRGLGVRGGLPTTILVDEAGCTLGIIEGPADWAGPDALALLRTALGE